jgi:hypothetical protein
MTCEVVLLLYLSVKIRLHTGHWWGNLRKRDHLEDPGVEGRKIIEMYLEEVGIGMDWIGLAQNKDRWRAVVNAAMNLQVT